MHTPEAVTEDVLSECENLGVDCLVSAYDAAFI